MAQPVEHPAGVVDRALAHLEVDQQPVVGVGAAVGRHVAVRRAGQRTQHLETAADQPAGHVHVPTAENQPVGRLVEGEHADLRVAAVVAPLGLEPARWRLGDLAGRSQQVDPVVPRPDQSLGPLSRRDSRDTVQGILLNPVPKLFDQQCLARLLSFGSAIE